MMLYDVMRSLTVQIELRRYELKMHKTAKSFKSPKSHSVSHLVFAY